MTTINQHCRKFQELLRELFQFDCADLDFGIYRIMNYKRDVLEKFISEDLPGFVDKELDRGNLAEQSEIAGKLEEVTGQIRGTLGPDALDYDGNLAEVYHDTPLGRKYLKIKARATGVRNREALEAAIFNNLYAFFSRYYQDGDFISKRRYSKRQRYAIPYNGEEFLLYWANRDQYYVKNAEHFHDYSFTSHGVAVHFKLRSASVEQNNVKGDKRFFLPIVKEVACDDKAKQVVIPFEYRPLSVHEEGVYHGGNQQASIIAEALVEIPKRLKKHELALLALVAERGRSGDGESVSFLEHHLLQYTQRNTSDFFIHKELKEFLSRELDFYLKNEVLNLDELEAAGENRSEGWFQVMRAVKSVGGWIIDFLDQIERFQKMLWEKRKFITKTEYCITVGNIEDKFYPKIVACESQWVEWRELFRIDEEETNLFNSKRDLNDKRFDFLKSHPTLVLDTKHFDDVFVDSLLGSMGNLDDQTDGLLIHGENFQSLNLLLEKYRESVKCVYIDPPYNTGNGDFIYRDTYQHSCWLAMMHDRLSLLKTFMSNSGVQFVSCDDNEQALLVLLLAQVFGEQNIVGTLPTVMNLKGNQDQFAFAGTHEYTIFTTKVKQEAKFGQFYLDEEELMDWEQDDYGFFKRGANLKSTGANAPRQKRPNLYFPLYVTSDGEVSVDRTGDSDREIYPITNDEEMSWRWSKEKCRREHHNLIVAKEKSSLAIYKKQRPNVGDLPSRKPKSLLYKPEYSSGNGTAQIKALFDKNPFQNPKPLELIQDIVLIGSDDKSLVMDVLAGSGTTGHAIINLNRRDGGSRKFILVEMGQYFDTVLLPRIKKITFAPEWKNGKPKRMATQEETGRSPRIIKYMCLEDYEDTLSNIGFDDSLGQQTLKFKDYLLKYMLKWETRSSETFLNAEKLSLPFGYRLRIHSNGQTREKTADIPETFNYLMGIRVQKRRVYDDDGRRYLVYRGLIDKRQVAVVWRETEGWEQTDLERDKEFVAESKFVEGAEEIFVNGDSFIPNAKSLEPAFKSRMFAPVET